MSRPQTVHPNSRLRSSSVRSSARSRHQKGCRNTNSSCLGRDAKTMSRPRSVWPKLLGRCPGRGRALELLCVLLRAQPPLPFFTCCPSVTTSKPGRDQVLEIGSSHSSFCLAPKFFYFFFQTSSSFPATPRMQ